MTTLRDEDLWDGLLAPRGGRTGLRVMGRTATFAAWDEVLREAACRAAGLAAVGVEPGSVVAGVLNNTYDAAVGLFAAWFAGATFASLPERPRGMGVPEYHIQLARIAADCGARLVLGDRLSDSDPALSASSVRPWASLGETKCRIGRTVAPPCGIPAVIQYSSGSTGPPKGCLLSARAIAEQQRILAELTAVERGVDVECSWVPMSHDMGLFGALIYSCYHDVDLALSSPERFMMAPRSWFADLAETGAATTPGTNTSLALAARVQRGPLPQQLRVRSAIIGAEPVDWPVLQAAAEVFGSSGLSPAALRPAYGMAEVTLAASCTALGVSARRLLVDREALEHDLVQLADGRTAGGAVSVTSCGVPCPGTEVTSSRPGGCGELAVASPSLASGYVGQSAATSAVRDGRFYSEDLGFVHDGEVYVLGRVDDVVVDAGRNIHLGELESAVETAAGTKKGRAFLLDMRQLDMSQVEAGQGRAAELVAVVELPRPPDDLAKIDRLVRESVMARSGTVVSGIVVVRKGELPLTPSGKKQRRRLGQRLGEGQLEVVAFHGAGAAAFT